MRPLVHGLRLCLAGLLGAAPAFADPVLSFGPSDIAVETVFDGLSEVRVRDRGTVDFDDPTAFNAFQLTPLAPFPGNLTAPPQGFIQATANGRARIAAGAGGVTVTSSSSFAFARYSQMVTNIGDEPATVVVEIDIPQILVALLLNTPGEEGPVSSVHARLDVIRQFSGGITTENIFIFAAGLDQELGQAVVPLTLSDDLRPLAVVEQFADAAVFGARILPFRTRQTLGVLDPNTSFEFDYSLILSAGSTVPERGSLALFGDPFNFEEGNNGFRVFIEDAAAPPSVPEPGIWTMTLAGLAIAAARRRRVRGHRAT